MRFLTTKRDLIGWFLEAKAARPEHVRLWRLKFEFEESSTNFDEGNRNGNVRKAENHKYSHTLLVIEFNWNKVGQKRCTFDYSLSAQKYESYYVRENRGVSQIGNFKCNSPQKKVTQRQKLDF